MLRTIILLTRGLLMDMRARRWAMFILLMIALVMMFAGITFLSGNISTPMTFLIYWGVCAWLTFTALMLALWDMLLIREAARKARLKLEKEMTQHRRTDDQD